MIGTRTMDKKSRQITRDAFLAILPAQILASLIPFLSGIINGVVIGNCYSANMISVIGFTTPVTYLLSSVRTLFSIGGGATAGNYMGQGKLSKVNETFRLCITTLVMIAIILMVSILLFNHQIAGMISDDEDLIMETARYLKGLALGFIPSLLIPFLSSYLQLAGSSKRVVFSSILNAAMNLGFDLVAVMVFHTDVMGIGVATSIAQWISAAYLFISIIRTHFVSFSFSHSDIRILSNVLRFGINSCILVALESVRNSIIVKQSYVLGGLNGSTAISVLFASCGLVDFITSGFMSASMMIGSLYAGEENEDALSMSSKWAMLVGEIAGLLSGALFFIFAKPIALAFSSTIEGLPLAIAAIRIYAVYIMIVNPLQIILRFYQCLKRVKTTFVLFILREFVIAIAAIFILGSLFGVRGVWMCFPVSAILGGLVVIGLSAYKSWKQKRKKLDLLWYDGSTTFTDSENFYVTDLTQLDSVLESVSVFCDRNNMDKKSAMACRLLAEENITTLLEHADIVRKRNLMISIFVGTNGDLTRLIFQDNSPQFDPLKRFHFYDEEKKDLIKDASISIVKGFAENTSYQFSFGMNIFMVDIVRR